MIEPSDEILEKISDAVSNNQKCSDGKVNGIKIIDNYFINSCNVITSGTIDIDEIEYGFVIENGDMRGNYVHKWGLSENVGIYEPEYREPMTFVPENDYLLRHNPELFNVYVLWRKEQWFKDMVRDYNYDRHFQPGGYVENYYREKSAKRGLKPGLLSNLSKEERELIKE